MLRRRIATVLLAVVGALPLIAQAATTNPTGFGSAHENVQLSLGLNYIIAISGIFPSGASGDGGPEFGGGATDRFLGEVMLITGPYAPQGWALANGQLLNNNQNVALHALLGTTYGGNSTQFALPDLRGRVPIGAGQGSGLTNRAMGQQVGAEFGTLATAQLPVHTHLMPGGATSTGTAGSGAAHSEMQPSLTLKYMVALESFGGAQLVGEVILSAANIVPQGWAVADGSLLPVSQYAELNSIVGTTYGGNGTTTFGLPDLRGRTAMGVGEKPGLTQRFLGDVDGAESVALTSAQLPIHSHTLSIGGSTGTAGNGEAHSNLQPSLALNYIVSLYGVYPSPPGASGGETGSGGSGSSGDAYIGEMRLFAGNFAPAGWAFADGSLLAIAEYDALFNLIGTTYGGDGETTFALPDLRGQLAMGMGSGPGLSSRSLGFSYGAEAMAMNVFPLAAHSHAYAAVAGDFNFNDVIDAADYVVWRKNNGPESQYNSWRTNFGRTFGSSGGSEGAVFDGMHVPEPGAAAMVFLVAAAMAAGRYRTRGRRQ